MNALGTNSIVEALLQLDKLVDPIVIQVEKETQHSESESGYQGLYVVAEQAIGVLARRKPKVDEKSLVKWTNGVKNEKLFEYLKKIWPALSEIDYGMILLALAPEYDPRYERRYGFLHDDVTRRRPSVELAKLIFDPAGSGSVTDRLDTSSLLIKEHLLEVKGPADGRPGWNTRELRLDDQLTRLLLGWKQLDPRLQVCAEVESPSDTHSRCLPERIWPSLATIKPFRVYLHGPDEWFNLNNIRKIACLQRWSMLVIDCRKLNDTDRPVNETIFLALREARWFDHLLVLTGLDVMHSPERSRVWEQVCATLSKAFLLISLRAADPTETAYLKFAHTLVMLGGRDRLPGSSHPLQIMEINIPLPHEQERYEHWTSLTNEAAVDTSTIKSTDRDVLAGCYPLTRSQIAAAVSEAVTHARQSAGFAGTKLRLTFEDLALAARQQGSQELDSLTTRITPRVQLNDVVAPEEVRTQLDEIISRVHHRRFVLREWGFARRQSHGLGINALFAGPPGTGKTMAAEAIANALNKDLYKIDLTSVISKYIGETEQKLEQVFRAGETTEAVLFFDEADSLLGKRSEVKDAHDRYANLEVSYLLQRMERYDGLIILATNLPGNLDDAFLRRMASIVHFPQPAARERAMLWNRVWPRDEKDNVLVHLSEEKGEAIDADFLAERFDLSGGHIRNAALAAAFAAADRPWYPVVTMVDVLLGVKREYQKLGQVMSDQKLGLNTNRFKQPPTKPRPSGLVTPVAIVTPSFAFPLEVGHEA